jgi:hypothetical protein
MTPCPVCLSTKRHCVSLKGDAIAPHVARGGTAVDVSPRIGARIDDLADRAGVPSSAVLEWAIWQTLRACGVPVPREIRGVAGAGSWSRIEAAR